MPDAVVLDTRVTGVQAADATGRFGLRPGHEPFVTVLVALALLVYTDEDGRGAVRGGRRRRAAARRRPGLGGDARGRRWRTGSKTSPSGPRRFSDARRRQEAARPRPSSTNSRPRSRSNWPEWGSSHDRSRARRRRVRRARSGSRPTAAGGARPEASGRGSPRSGRSAGWSRCRPSAGHSSAAGSTAGSRTGIFWTLSLLTVGLAIGCVAAWRHDEPGVARMNWAAAVEYRDSASASPTSAGSGSTSGALMAALAAAGSIVSAESARLGAGRGHFYALLKAGGSSRWRRVWSGCSPPGGIWSEQSGGTPDGR